MKTIDIESYKIYSSDITNIAFDKKTTINTINAHSYIVAEKDSTFRNALIESDILLPDGYGIVLMAKMLKKEKIKKIAGADIHNYLLNKANDQGLKCFYLGASESTLQLIRAKQIQLFPNIKFSFFSPPFKEHFSVNDNKIMIDEINSFSPDFLFVGMTAPKQEKWVHENKDRINAQVICSIGAVFDFIAGTKKRAPNWIINLKLEWLYRSFTAWRLTKRYFYSTPLFLWRVLKLSYFSRV